MSSPARKSVKFFYDVVSPYTWIAFEVLCRYNGKWNMNLELKPFFLGGVMQASGNKPPATLPNKGAYMPHDLARLAKHFALPVKFPENPGESIFGSTATLLAQRFLVALEKEDKDKLEEVSRQLWYRVWAKDLAVNKPEYVAEAAKAAGLSDSVIQKLLESTQTPAIKDALKANTEEAMNHGAFGAPTILITDEKGHTDMVFGSDRFHIIADLLGEKYEGPLNERNKCKL